VANQRSADFADGACSIGRDTLRADGSVLVLQVVQVQKQPELDGAVLHVGFEGNSDAAIFAELAMHHALEGFRETSSAGVGIVEARFPAAASFVEDSLGRIAAGQKNDARLIVGPRPGDSFNQPIWVRAGNLADHPGRGRAVDGRPFGKAVGKGPSAGGCAAARWRVDALEELLQELVVSCAENRIRREFHKVNSGPLPGFDFLRAKAEDFAARDLSDLLGLFPESVRPIDGSLSQIAVEHDDRAPFGVELAELACHLREAHSVDGEEDLSTAKRSDLLIVFKFAQRE
jgi:hypothetical protein